MAVERVESRRFPYLPIRVTVDGRTIEAEALLDTGFDGDLVVPLAQIASGDEPDEYRAWSLADGSEIETPIFYGEVRIGHLAGQEADIAGMGNEVIIGRGLTDNYLIVLDHARRVIVEP